MAFKVSLYDRSRDQSILLSNTEVTIILRRGFFGVHHFELILISQQNIF